MASAFIFAMGVTSCVNDLDVDPTINPSTSMVFERDQIFAKIYANMALTGQQGPAGMGDIADIDEGTSDFSRQLWNMNQLPTDETICNWGDAGVSEYNFATWDASHSMITALYYRLYFGITLANFYLENTNDDNSDEAVMQRAEVRFLRALYYFYAMDLYGNIPFLTVVTSENAPQASREEVFAFIESELIGEGGCIEDMAEPRTNTYGRTDKAAGWMLIARLYLNAEVYTGTANWTDAASYAEKVMNSAYSLAPNYKNLFMGDNNTNGAECEVLLPILQDGLDTQNYGGSLFLIASTHKDDMGTGGTSENWAGNRARRQLMDKFFPTSDAPAVASTDMVAAAGDDRALFFGIDRTLAIDAVEDIADFTKGYSCDKFTNIYSTGADPRDAKFTDTDIPFMRAAEANLTYAEAKTRLGESAAAKTAIDELRDRANAGKQTSYSLDDICDEWSREFYFEGRRRMDLIRFGRFGGASDYTWEWKGGSKEGTTISVNKNVFGIPTKDITANSNLVQNTGY